MLVRKGLLLLLIFLVACSSLPATSVDPTATPLPKPTPTAWPRARMKSPEYGIQAFLWWKPEITKRDLTLVQQMGFTWVKQNIAWRDVEGQAKGHYEWENADNVVRRVGKRGNLKLLVRLDRQPFWTQVRGTPPLEDAPPTNLNDFGDFCHALAGKSVV